MLHKTHVFIAEDEPFIALDLAAIVVEARGIVVGPAASVREALGILDQAEPHVGMLDVSLSDGDIRPVADLLTSRGIPILFYCALGLTDDMKLRYPSAPVFIKPSPLGDLVRFVASLVGGHRVS